MDLPFFDTMDECNELLQDLAVNYQKERLYQGYLPQVLPLAEQLSKTYDAEEMQQKGQAFFREWKKYEALMHRFMENELFSDLVLPDGDLESMVVQMQWIAMEYNVIRHSLFLKWMQDGCGELKYETLRDYIVLITRMTGYEEADIYEYRLKKGDIILMCTDGLSNMVEDEDMFNIVKGSRDVVEAVQMLIEKANSNGGRDNIGVIVAEPLADEVSVW